jgi:hypothetical protein
MTKENYNGWLNRETWLVALWLNNDEATHEKAKSFELISELQDFVENLVFGEEASLKEDLIGAALGRVDFLEVFQALHEK